MYMYVNFVLHFISILHVILKKSVEFFFFLLYLEMKIQKDLVSILYM